MQHAARWRNGSGLPATARPARGSTADSTGRTAGYCQRRQRPNETGSKRPSVFDPHTKTSGKDLPHSLVHSVRGPPGHASIQRLTEDRDAARDIGGIALIRLQNSLMKRLNSVMIL